MKKIAIIFLILGLLLTSCAEDSISKQENRAEKQRKEQPETKVESISIDDYSYWFVVVEEKRGALKINKFVRQEHQYFSSDELKTEFSKDVFILNIVQISRETYEHNE